MATLSRKSVVDTGSHSLPSLFLVSVLAGVALLVAGPAWPAPQAERAPMEAAQSVVIPFDFQSDFDHGRYGRIVGDLIWKQLERRGGFVLPESMLDVRDWSARRKIVPGPDTPLSQMRRIVREDFDADIGIWGKVQRVAGVDADLYDVSIVIADFSGHEPRMIYRETTRTRSVSQIPHVLVKSALDRLCGPRPAAVPPVDEVRESLWQRGPNLVHGDFQKGDRAPVGWDPLPPQVSLVTVDADSGSKNRIVRFDLPKDVAGTTGVLYYSDFFPVEEGATYRFQCRWRSTGSKAKVFIKCYDQVEGEYRETGRRRGQRGYHGAGARQRREVYRSQQNLVPYDGKRTSRLDTAADDGGALWRWSPVDPAGAWSVHRQDFTPRHTQFTPRWGRVMLYAYWPAGSVCWDDIVVKQIAPPPVTAPKARRPSLETEVLSDEGKHSSGR